MEMIAVGAIEIRSERDAEIAAGTAMNATQKSAARARAVPVAQD